MSIEQPELGEIRRGHEIGKENDSHLYIWYSCPNCNLLKWKVSRHSKVIYPLCGKCGKPTGGKSQKGIKRRIPKSYIDNPKIGEVRYAIDIGFKNTGRKYIWYSCELCNKERWVALKSDNTPQNPRCSICAKTGSIKTKSLNPSRKCSGCHKEYPATTEYFSKAVGSHRGISQMCKDCKRTQNKLYARKRRTIAKHRLHSAISGSVNSSLREKKNGRRWEGLVGYTLDDLMKHLESLFTDGMTWDNYGVNGWWVDHLTPVAAFSFQTSKDIDFKRCWALSNLQPLWKIDNILKADKVDKPFQPALQLQVGERRGIYVLA